MVKKKKITPAQKCRRNGWTAGTILKRRDLDFHSDTQWRITAVGEDKVLGRRIKFAEMETGTPCEQLLELDDFCYRWWRIGVWKKDDL